MLNDEFVHCKHVTFTSQDVNCWTGDMWIVCELLWCFNQLFGLSFWRHPFTAEDPLVIKWCNANFFLICLVKKQTHLILGWPEGKYFLSKYAYCDTYIDDISIISIYQAALFWMILKLYLYVITLGVNGP